MNATITASTRWPAIMFGQKTHGQHEVLDEQPQELDRENHRDQEKRQRAGQIHVRHLRLEEADEARLLHAGAHDGGEGYKRQHRSWQAPRWPNQPTGPGQTGCSPARRRTSSTGTAKTDQHRARRWPVGPRRHECTGAWPRAGSTTAPWDGRRPTSCWRAE